MYSILDEVLIASLHLGIIATVSVITVIIDCSKKKGYIARLSN